MEGTKQPVHFERLWQAEESTYHLSLKKLWRKHFPKLSADDLDKRARQAVWVIVTPEGTVVGVSTCYKAYIDQLKNDLYVFRCFIDPAFRIPGLPSTLLVRTRDLLEEDFISGKDTSGCIGLITLVENEQIMKTRNEAVWPASKMIFMGNSPKGYPLRVYYFRKALIGS